MEREKGFEPSTLRSEVLEHHTPSLTLHQVIAKKLELQGVGSSDGSDGITNVATEPGETLPSGAVE